MILFLSKYIDFVLFSQTAILFCTTKEGGLDEAKDISYFPIQRFFHEKEASYVLNVLYLLLHALFADSKDLYDRKNSRCKELKKRQENLSVILPFSHKLVEQGRRETSKLSSRRVSSRRVYYCVLKS